MARDTKLILNMDDFYELEIFKDGYGDCGISVGIHNLQKSEIKEREYIINLNHEDLDKLINTLIELRYE